MRRGHIIGAVLLALLGAAFVVGTASAAPAKRAPQAPYPPDAFELQGTNGFTVVGTMYAGARGSKHGTFNVTVTRGHDFVAYSVAAAVTPTSVRADLGRLGRVDLTLHPSGGEATVKLPCSRGQSLAYEPGTFEGVFEFRGEGGFTRASATSVPAALDFGPRPLDAVCGANWGEELGGDLPGARLKAVSYAGGRTLKFQLNKNRTSGKTLYTASLSERREGMRIFHELSGTAPASAFRFGKSLKTATIDPPAPFSGTARVTRSPDAVSPLLSGGLELSFLGRTVKLAGPAVHVSLEHARQTHGEGGTISVGI